MHQAPGSKLFGKEGSWESMHKFLLEFCKSIEFKDFFAVVDTPKKSDFLRLRGTAKCQVLFDTWACPGGELHLRNSPTNASGAVAL
jgi:hypothetical protein